MSAVLNTLREVCRAIGAAASCNTESSIYIGCLTNIEIDQEV